MHTPGKGRFSQLVWRWGVLCLHPSVLVSPILPPRGDYCRRHVSSVAPSHTVLVPVCTQLLEKSHLAWNFANPGRNKEEKKRYLLCQLYSIFLFFSKRNTLCHLNNSFFIFFFFHPNIIVPSTMQINWRSILWKFREPKVFVCNFAFFCHKNRRKLDVEWKTQYFCKRTLPSLTKLETRPVHLILHKTSTVIYMSL